MKNKELEKVSKRNPIALYIRYEEGNLNQMMKKVEILENYCEENNYEIVKKYFDYEKDSWQYFSNTMRNLLRDIGSSDYNTIIACDVQDFSNDLDKILVMYKIFDDEDMVIKTINQGIIGDDMLVGSTCFINALQKEKLYEPRIVYKDNGEVVDRTESIFWPIRIID